VQILFGNNIRKGGSAQDQRDMCKATGRKGELKTPVSVQKLRTAYMPKPASCGRSVGGDLLSISAMRQKRPAGKNPLDGRFFVNSPLV
jgi:hypothetical protein